MERSPENMPHFARPRHLIGPLERSCQAFPLNTVKTAFSSENRWFQRKGCFYIIQKFFQQVLSINLKWSSVFHFTDCLCLSFPLRSRPFEHRSFSGIRYCYPQKYCPFWQFPHSNLTHGETFVVILCQILKFFRPFQTTAMIFQDIHCCSMTIIAPFELFHDRKPRTTLKWLQLTEWNERKKT